MSTRLNTNGSNSGVLENALGWFADGIALLRADGSLVYANETLHAFAERGDGIRIFARAIEFAAADSQKRLDAALGALARLGGPPATSTQPTSRSHAKMECQPILYRCARWWVLAHASPRTP